MPDVDMKAESVNNYIKEFLKEIDSAFLDPNFNTLDYLVHIVEQSQTREGESKQRAFLKKQTDAIEKCLVPIVQAYYADYNNSLASLTAICDDFRKNQKEVMELAKRVEEVRGRLSSNHSGIQTLYYEKLLTEYTLKSLKNIEYIRQAPKIIDNLLDNSLFIRASNLYNEVAAMLSDSSIAEVPTVISLHSYWDMKKKDIENILMDRLLTVVYKGDSIQWSSYTNEGYGYHELTEEKEKEVVSNSQYTCSKYTAIAIIIKAATLIGCNLAAQNRLQSNSVSNINETILSSINETIQRIDDPKDPLKKGPKAVEYSLKHILMTCEDIFRTHICCIEAFLNSVVEGRLSYADNINPEYNTMSVFTSIQIAIKGFVERYITLPTTSSAVSALRLTQTNNRGKGMIVSFSFSSSPAWISSQQSVLSDLREKRYDVSSYSRLCDPDMILLCVICFYVKSFLEQTTILANESMTRVEKMKQILRVHDEDADLSELTSLSNYLHEHIDSDLYSTLMDRAVSITQSSLNKPESYLINENDGHTLNCVIDLRAGWDELEQNILYLQSSYYEVVPVLQKLIDSCCAKFTTLVDEMVRGSFAKKRYDWAANGGKLLLYNNPKYAAILAEIPHFPEFEFQKLSKTEQADEEKAINSDIYSFFIDPPVEKNHLILNGRVILLCNVCEGCVQLINHILEKKVNRHENQDSKYPLDYGIYDKTVDDCVMTLKGVHDYCIQILLNEINARCYYYLQKLTGSFTSNSYNSVPPVIMELMKDMKSLSDIMNDLCSPSKVDLFGHQLQSFLSTLLMRSITRIPVEEVDDSIICTLKQSSVCCSQIMNLLLPFSETISITRRLTDYFSLALMTKEEIKKYIEKHPKRFTNIDYMNLFKITTKNRERDDAAIDWIEDILTASQKK